MTKRAILLEKRLPAADVIGRAISLGHFFRRREVDDRCVRRFGNSQPKKRLVASRVAGVAACHGLTVSSLEARHVLALNGIAHRLQHRIGDRFQDGIQIHLRSLFRRLKRTNLHRPFEMGLGRVQVIACQGPVFVLSGEPKIGEVVADISHGMGLIGQTSTHRLRTGLRSFLGTRLRNRWPNRQLTRATQKHAERNCARNRNATSPRGQLGH